jgi:hypothetical protein
MTPALIPVNTPRGLAAINSRVPALFLPHAKAAERFWEFFTVGDALAYVR